MSYEKLKTWRQETKQLLIKAMGGGCNRCGYNKTMSGLDFHHVDSKAKEFNISKVLCNPYKRSLIIEEARKCVLLCKLCHCELHDGLWSLSDIKVFEFNTSDIPWYVLKEERICEVCKQPFKPKTKRQKCCDLNCGSSAREGKKNNPTKEELQKLLWHKPMTEIANLYGVSDKAVSKWAKKYNCKKPPMGFWLKNKVKTGA